VSKRVEKLEQEMADLRARAAALEGQLRQAQEQARGLPELRQQVADLRSQIAAEAARKAQAEEQQAARREQVESAVSALFSAEQVLARGDPAVGAALDDAERNLGGQAGRDVAAARLALQNHDLAQARYFLGIAIAHARQGQ
jgi:chromosome segregation ATPase